jgi:hypothetical protein
VEQWACIPPRNGVEPPCFGNVDGRGKTVPAPLLPQVGSPPGSVFPVLDSGRGRKQWSRPFANWSRKIRWGWAGRDVRGRDPRPPSGLAESVAESGAEFGSWWEIENGGADTTRSTTVAIVSGDG